MNEPSGNTLTIGIDGDLPWTPASTTAAGYPGIGLRAQYNQFEADADTIFHYSFSGNPVDWNAEVAGSVKDSGPDSNDGDPISGYGTSEIRAGSDWLGQSLNTNYVAWHDGYARVRIPVGGTVIPRATPFTLQWWMKLNSLPRNDAGGLFNGSAAETSSTDQYLSGNIDSSNLMIYAYNCHWYEAVRGTMYVPRANFDDGKWHHFRYVLTPNPAPATGGYKVEIFCDGVQTGRYNATGYSYTWTKDFTIGKDLYWGSHWNDASRPWNWEGAIDADFDDVVLHKSVVDDVVSRWKCLAADNTACSAVQTVDFGMSQRLTGISWTEATPQADERLQSIEVDDGAGFKLVWEYGAPAVDISGLLAASAFDIRITQQHSSDTVHEFAHILESLTLDYEAAGGYRRPPLTYRMGPKMFTGGMI